MFSDAGMACDERSWATSASAIREDGPAVDEVTESTFSVLKFFGLLTEAKMVLAQIPIVEARRWKWLELSAATKRAVLNTEHAHSCCEAT